MQYLTTSTITPIQFVSAGEFISERQWVHARRSNDSFEIIAGINKTLYIEQNNEKYEVNPGEILILQPFNIHQGFRECANDISFFWFHFHFNNPFELIDQATFEQEISSWHASDVTEENTIHSRQLYIPIYSKPLHINRWNVFSQQLLHVSNSKYYNNQMSDYLLTSLLIELSEQTISSYISNKESSSDKSFANILEWVRIHTSEELTLTQVAEKFNYNKDYLSRIFKQKMNMNFISYVHSLKITKSKELLARTNLGVKEISHQIGMPDDKHFLKIFKRHEKMTPTQFRRTFFRTYMNNHEQSFERDRNGVD